MSVFLDLLSLYEGEGITVQTSLSPGHFPGFNSQDIPFTYLYRGGVQLAEGGGIAFAELAFLEHLFTAIHPQRLFVVGNAFGWSTLALAILNPGARIVAIHVCPTEIEEEGIAFTNEMGARLGLDVRARKGKSPDHVAAIIDAEMGGPVDFALIDGWHTNEAQRADFEAVKAVADGDCVYLFHDVVNLLLADGFAAIAKDNPALFSSLLFRTPSGMAISYPAALDAALAPIVRAFTESDERVRALWKEGRARRENSE
ncbi:MAG: class I SAM-dependent methyltransferase [Rhodospirillales bacterium]